MLKKEKVGEVGRIVLIGLAIAGTLAVLSFQPAILAGAIPIFKSINKKKQYYLKNAITKLKAQGLVRITKNDGKYIVTLTDRGCTRANLYKTGHKGIEKPRHWDGKWRVVIFDIWEKRKTMRELFRKQLYALGFVRVQDSVWVHPYPCDEIVALLKTDAMLGKAVLYMTVESMENDRWLRDRFFLA